MAFKAPRKLYQNAVNFIGFVVNFDEAGIATGVHKATLPSGAIIIGTDIHVATAFNATTTNVLTVGSNSTQRDNIIASGDVNEGATGLTKDISPTGTALGPISAHTPLYAKYTQTGPVATAGVARVIIKY